jgi:hypothetical protein
MSRRVSGFSDTSELLDELHTRAKSADATLVGIAMKPRARVAESLQTAAEAVELARTKRRDEEESDGNGRSSRATAIRGRRARGRVGLRCARAAADEIGSMRTRWRLSAGLVLAAWALVWGFGLAWFAYVRVEAPTMPADRDARPQPDASESVRRMPPSAHAHCDTGARTSAVAAATTAMRDSATVADACEAVAGLSDAAQIGRRWRASRTRSVRPAWCCGCGTGIRWRLRPRTDIRRICRGASGVSRQTIRI